LVERSGRWQWKSASTGVKRVTITDGGQRIRRGWVVEIIRNLLPNVRPGTLIVLGELGGSAPVVEEFSSRCPDHCGRSQPVGESQPRAQVVIGVMVDSMVREGSWNDIRGQSAARNAGSAHASGWVTCRRNTGHNVLPMVQIHVAHELVLIR